MADQGGEVLTRHEYVACDQLTKQTFYLLGENGNGGGQNKQQTALN